MGKNSAIEWTHHTFNPWWGCVKVSPGCEHCYAENLSTRYGHDVWGPAKTTTRRTFGDKHWQEPLKWQKDAAAQGVRRRVFSGSMCDVFEDHPDVVDEREKLFELIDRTPNLDWLLLTKRPENILRLWPFGGFDGQFTWPNVWLGTSVEDQQRAEERIPHLLQIPAAVRFLSCEPLLGPVNLFYPTYNMPQGALGGHAGGKIGRGIDWVIVGGESGPKARPMDPAWALSLRDQCVMAGVPYFFKQWGEYLQTPDGKYRRMGKKMAGRLLEGRTWDEFPKSSLTLAQGFDKMEPT